MSGSIWSGESGFSKESFCLATVSFAVPSCQELPWALHDQAWCPHSTALSETARNGVDAKGTCSTLDSLHQPEVQVLLSLLTAKPANSGIQHFPPPETFKAELCFFLRTYWRALSGTHWHRCALVLGSMYLCHVLCQLLLFPRTPFKGHSTLPSLLTVIRKRWFVQHESLPHETLARSETLDVTLARSAVFIEI